MYSTIWKNGEKSKFKGNTLAFFQKEFQNNESRVKPTTYSELLRIWLKTNCAHLLSLVVTKIGSKLDVKLTKKIVRVTNSVTTTIKTNFRWQTIVNKNTFFQAW